MALDLRPFKKQALAVVDKLKNMKLRALILDDWRGGPRLIYQFSFTTTCGSACSECPVFTKAKIGVDPAVLRPGKLITTLVMASNDERQLFSGGQRFLNCKSWEQYLDCYVTWLTRKCQTQQDFDDEVSLVANFRLIFYRDFTMPAEIEMLGKRSIIKTALLGLPFSPKQAWLKRAAAKHDLI